MNSGWLYFDPSNVAESTLHNMFTSGRFPPSEYQRLLRLTRDMSKLAKDTNVVNYPHFINEGEEFIPQLGDKMERTDIQTGTVVTGIISNIAETFTGHRGYDSSGLVLYMRSANYSHRLLYREPQKLKVGDTTTWEVAQYLPNGSVLSVTGAYDVVLVSGNGPKKRNHIQRIDCNYSWQSFNPDKRVRIKYIND